MFLLKTYIIQIMFKFLFLFLLARILEKIIGQETEEKMFQFLGPETDVMGERYSNLKFSLEHHIKIENAEDLVKLFGQYFQASTAAPGKSFNPVKIMQGLIDKADRAQVRAPIQPVATP